jgi:hypothetical protein
LSNSPRLVQSQYGLVKVKRVPTVAPRTLHSRRPRERRKRLGKTFLNLENVS